jgi:hypothetical protein
MLRGYLERHAETLSPAAIDRAHTRVAAALVEHRLKNRPRTGRRWRPAHGR